MKITDIKATTLKGYKQWNYVLIETDAGPIGMTAAAHVCAAMEPGHLGIHYSGY